jgi:hypothetical protein
LGRGSALGGAAAFVTPFGRKPTGRAELPRPAAPVTGRLRSPPHRPDAVPVGEDQADGPRELRRCRKSRSNGDGTPRIVRVGPSSLNGASHPASGTRLRRAVDLGASTDPAGLTAGPG